MEFASPPKKLPAATGLRTTAVDTHNAGQTVNDRKLLVDVQDKVKILFKIRSKNQQSNKVDDFLLAYCN